MSEPKKAVSAAEIDRLCFALIEALKADTGKDYVVRIEYRRTVTGDVVTTECFTYDNASRLADDVRKCKCIADAVVSQCRDARSSVHRQMDKHENEVRKFRRSYEQLELRLDVVEPQKEK